ncbi:MAG TPA: MotA/TolQ/ExbB proton channel family protein [Longimicrobiaceae bacterium]|nr:MotA/TolQ/ExbB proton channel family protein [Longimicrobiaceae bacterium]
MSSPIFSLALLQIPGMEQPDMTWQEQLVSLWEGGGWMMYFLAVAAIVGAIVIVWKLIDLTSKGARTKRVLRDVDGLVAEGRIAEATETAQASNTPAGRILAEGLRRHNEGTERVIKAIENAGLIEMAKLERGLVILATVSTVAPLLGFLGTVIGMIEAFQAIELAGEVEATLVARGIKIALITTAAGLIIAIPVSIAHNYFVSKIDRLVIDMEESAQRTIDHLHEAELAAR